MAQYRDTSIGKKLSLRLILKRFYFKQKGIKMRLNQKPQSLATHEGGIAQHITPLQQLERTIMSCMLWEGNFYEDGQSVAERIKSLVSQVDGQAVLELAIKARTVGKLRHVPLLLTRYLALEKHGKQYVSDALAEIIQRPDELSEFLAIYWKDEEYIQGKKQSPLSAQVKKGLARAFKKFDEYSLAKYNRETAIKLRDVLFLCHAKPETPVQADLWSRLISGNLATPDTWEVELSGSSDKLASWTRLVTENKLGALALLRNIRNMQTVGVDKHLIETALKNMKIERVLPFRFITAAQYAPHLEPVLEEAMLKCLAGQDVLKGKTLLLIDVSGSMSSMISSKSEISAMDAACGLAILAREICEETEVMTFSHNVVDVPTRRGFALRDAIVKSQPHGGTWLGKAIDVVNQNKTYDRIIVFTDEQTADRVPNPKAELAYMVNVAAYKNGVGYGAWRHIDGFSENILSYIGASEASNN